MPAMDYNQQLLAYLQTCRQLLDQWTAMAAAGMAPTVPLAMPSAPFMAPGGQFMPPTMPPLAPTPPSAAAARPTPPAPGDYAQQLFGYLQAWRQYLEQMAGAGSQAPQPSTGATDNRPAKDGGTRPRGDDTGGDNTSRSGAAKGSDQALPPPRLVDIRPSNLGGTQLTETSPGQTTPPLVDVAPTSYSMNQIAGPGYDPAGPFGPTDTGLQEPQLLQPPGSDFGTEVHLPPHIPTLPHVPQPPSGVTSAGSAFQSAMDRLDPAAVREVAPKSLFSTPGAQTPSV